MLFFVWEVLNSDAESWSYRENLKNSAAARAPSLNNIFIETLRELLLHPAGRNFSLKKFRENFFFFFRCPFSRRVIYATAEEEHITRYSADVSSGQIDRARGARVFESWLGIIRKVFYLKAETAPTREFENRIIRIYSSGRPRHYRNFISRCSTDTSLNLGLIIRWDDKRMR